MMNNATTSEVKINETSVTEHAVYVSATCGKVSALVAIRDYNVQVICQNAHHKVWKCAGRMFPTITDALAAYKSPEMKAIITAADAANH